MNDYVIDLFKVLFLFGFTLHNLEEAVWLPEWSKAAGKYHAPVDSNQFVFAVIVITMLGYLITGLEFLLGGADSLVNYLYLGFIGMMGLNSIFPHLLGTIALKRYVPGLMTGLFLNLPFSAIIVNGYIKQGISIPCCILSIAIVSALVLLSLKPLFKLGDWLIQWKPLRPPKT